MHNRGFGNSLPQRRDFLSNRYQCHQSKLGMGPIRIRVVCNFNDNGTAEDRKEYMDVNASKASTDEDAKKSSRAKKVIKRLESLKEIQKAKTAKTKVQEEKRKAVNLKKDDCARHIILQLEASK